MTNDHLAFKKLFDFATVGIISVDEDGKILVINAYAENLFGYERNKLIGQQLELLIPERFRNKHSKLRNNYTTSPTSRPMGNGVTLYAVKKNGQKFPVEISLSHYKK